MLLSSALFVLLPVSLIGWLVDHRALSLILFGISVQPGAAAQPHPQREWEVHSPTGELTHCGLGTCRCVSLHLERSMSAEPPPVADLRLSPHCRGNT